MFRQAERDRQDRLAVASTPPMPKQPPESRREEPGALAERILLMANATERSEAIRAADTGHNLDFVDALDEQLADIGVSHLGELTPIAERRRAALLGEPPEERKRSKQEASPLPRSGPKGPDMG